MIRIRFVGLIFAILVSYSMASITVDFGTVQLGAAITTTVKLQNTTSKPINVVNLMTSCGCTSATYKPSKVVPDSFVELNVTVAPQNIGEFSEQVAIFCNSDTCLPPVQIIGKAESTFYAVPLRRDIVLDSEFTTRRTITQFKFVSKHGEPLPSNVNAYCQEDWIDTKIERLAPDRLQIDIIQTAIPPFGETTTEISLVSDKRSLGLFRLQVDVQSTIPLNPSELSFGFVERNTTLTAAIQLPPTVEDIQVACKSPQVQFEVIDSRIQVVISPPDNQTVTLDSDLFVRARMEGKQSTLRIPIRAGYY